MGDGSPAVWPPFTFLLLGALTTYAVALVTVVAWLRRARRAKPHRSNPADSGTPPFVTILKPVCGIDEQFEANFESFAALKYPHWEMICCARDPHDPALAVARRVAERHPECNIRIIAGAVGDAINPKVLLLEHMVPQSRSEVFWISDSNVRVEPGDLQALLAPLADPHVGLVFQPVVGVHEETAAAAMENYRLTQNAGGGMIFIHQLVGVNAVMGKGILIRRKALHGMGGFSQLRDVLAEDYLMGVHLERAGWKLALSPVPAQAVHQRWSLRGHVGRQTRHSSMRARLSPWTYPVEMFMNPVGLALLPLLTLGLRGLQMFAATAVVKGVLDVLMIRAVRGAWPKLRYVPLLAVEDVLMAVVWIAGVFNNRVNWRGTLYRMKLGTRLIRIDTAPAELRPSTPLRPAAVEPVEVAPTERRKAA